MIDPITAFATAQAAIKGVQAAIKMGKDIGAISGDLMKFFEAKDVVAKAASEPKKTFGKSDTAQAFETVMHAKQLQDAENELKQHLIWSGNADVWQAIMVERNNLVQKRKAEEIAMEKAKASPIFAAAYEAVFERRRKIEAEQTLIEMNSAINEMDVAGKAHSRARDLERSAYAHLIEAKKVWRIAMQLAEAETTNLQAACAKAQVLIDARKAARA